MKKTIFTALLLALFVWGVQPLSAQSQVFPVTVEGRWVGPSDDLRARDPGHSVTYNITAVSDFLAENMARERYGREYPQHRITNVTVHRTRLQEDIDRQQQQHQQEQEQRRQQSQGYVPQGGGGSGNPIMDAAGISRPPQTPQRQADQRANEHIHREIGRAHV